ncbi:MAG: DUF4838 domain-containing protein [Promethearchaeota archaeon]
MLREFYLHPKPKFIQIDKITGIILNKYLIVFQNKYKLQDTSLLLLSRIYKHLGTFLEISPILDRYLDPSISENYFFACMTTEEHFVNVIRPKLNEFIKNIIEKGKSSFNSFINEKPYTNSNFQNNSDTQVDNQDFGNLHKQLYQEEGYIISIESECMFIISKTLRGYYNAIQTAINIIDNAIIRHDNPEEYIKLPNMLIVDWPTTRIRGFHLDLNTITPTDEYLTNFIYFLGSCNFNYVFIEYEDKFPYKGNLKPILNKHSFTEDQLKVLLDTFELHHIKVVPLIQIFGHLERWLVKNEFQHLREVNSDKFDPNTAQSLCPLNPDSEKHIFEKIDQICKAHPDSEYIHLGGDEVYQLGTCEKCSQFVKEHSYSELYIRWINKAAEKVLQYGKIPIIWSDYLIKYPESIEKLNKKIVVMYWDYEAIYPKEKYLWAYRMEWYPNITSKNSKIPQHLIELYKKYYITDGFPDYIKTLPFYEFFIENQHDVIGAPSVASHFHWIVPDLYRAIFNVTAQSYRSYQTKSLGVLLTSWIGVSNPLETQKLAIYASSEALWNTHSIQILSILPSQTNSRNNINKTIPDNAINSDVASKSKSKVDSDIYFFVDWDNISKSATLNLFEQNPELYIVNLKHIFECFKWPRNFNENDPACISQIKDTLNKLNKFKQQLPEILENIYENKSIFTALSIGLKSRVLIFNVILFIYELKIIIRKFEDTDNFAYLLLNNRLQFILKELNKYNSELNKIKNQCTKFFVIEGKQVYYDLFDEIMFSKRRRELRLLLIRLPKIKKTLDQLLSYKEEIIQQIKQKIPDLANLQSLENLEIDSYNIDQIEMPIMLDDSIINEENIKNFSQIEDIIFELTKNIFLDII